jgi:hypothetical protein
VGNVIGGGIGLLENIFGVNEQETAGILSGQVPTRPIHTHVHTRVLARDATNFEGRLPNVPPLGRSIV